MPILYNSSTSAVYNQAGKEKALTRFKFIIKDIHKRKATENKGPVKISFFLFTLFHWGLGLGSGTA